MQGIIDSIQRWYKQPFQSGGSALTWILFVGLLIIAVGMWQLILIKILTKVE